MLFQECARPVLGPRGLMDSMRSSISSRHFPRLCRNSMSTLIHCPLSATQTRECIAHLLRCRGRAEVGDV
jgi:hypothetical protein